LHLDGIFEPYQGKCGIALLIFGRGLISTLVSLEMRDLEGEPPGLPMLYKKKILSGFMQYILI
jgi:hypothetical protein